MAILRVQKAMQIQGEEMAIKEHFGNCEFLTSDQNFNIYDVNIQGVGNEVNVGVHFGSATDKKTNTYKTYVYGFFYI